MKEIAKETTIKLFILMPSLTFLWQFCEFYLLSSSSRGAHKINMQFVSVKRYWKISQALEFVKFVAFKVHTSWITIFTWFTWWLSFETTAWRLCIHERHFNIIIEIIFLSQLILAHTTCAFEREEKAENLALIKLPFFMLTYRVMY